MTPVRIPGEERPKGVVHTLSFEGSYIEVIEPGYKLNKPLDTGFKDVKTDYITHCLASLIDRDSQRWNTYVHQSIMSAITYRSPRDTRNLTSR